MRQISCCTCWQGAFETEISTLVIKIGNKFFICFVSKASQIWYCHRDFSSSWRLKSRFHQVLDTDLKAGNKRRHKNALLLICLDAKFGKECTDSHQSFQTFKSSTRMFLVFQIQFEGYYLKDVIETCKNGHPKRNISDISGTQLEIKLIKVLLRSKRFPFFMLWADLVRSLSRSH